jgi:hypothetical protein
VKIGFARAFVVAVLSLFGATLAGAQAPAECGDTPPLNVFDLTIKPGVFQDSAVLPGGYDLWTLRGQVVPQTNVEIDLGPEQNRQKVSLFLVDGETDAMLYSKTLEPDDFETYGVKDNKWRHIIPENDAGPGDTWRVARFRTATSPSGTGLLNRLRFGATGVFDPPIELTDEEGPIALRLSLRVEPTLTNCATAPALCLCATYPLTCKPGRSGTLRCFSVPN